MPNLNEKNVIFLLKRRVECFELIYGMDEYIYWRFLSISLFIYKTKVDSKLDLLKVADQSINLVD